MPVRQVKSPFEDRAGRTRKRDKMETIWLQRSSPDIAWGFRMVGGREFGVPLTIQRVTPGSVAAAGLGPGDVILKIGNVMATNLEHNDAQELVRQSGNLLQLTIKKPDGSFQPGPLSPSTSGYGNQVTVQINDDYNSVPRGFGTGIPISANSNKNVTPNYATTPRNFGSQLQATRINQAQQRDDYNSSYQNDNNADNGGVSFPDYTVAYKEPVHDSPGGPANVQGYNIPAENTSYSSKSLPRSGYIGSGRDGFGGSQIYEPKAQIVNQSSFSPTGSSEAKFSTGLPLQTGPQKTQQSFTNAVPQSYQPPYNSPQPTYSSVARPFSPSTYQGPVSPRSQTVSTSGFASREPSTPSGSIYSQTPSNESGNSSFDQSNIHASRSGTYSTLPHSKPSYNTNNNNSFNVYNSSPQPFSAPKPFAPAQTNSSSTFNQTPAPFSPSLSRPFQGQSSPGSSSSSYTAPHSVIRKVSFDQTASENGPYIPATNFTARPYRPPQVATIINYPGPAYNTPGTQQDDARATDFGVSHPQPPSFSRQSSKPEDDVYTAVPYNPQAVPQSPRSEPCAQDYGSNRGYDLSGVNEGLDSLNLGSFKSEPPAVAPLPPPPPPPPGPPPPPAPPLSEWNATPYRRQNQVTNEENDEQKVPDQLLNTMMKSAKGGGPKPFSYGIDLSELKKKIGPPTAPKPRPDQPGYQDQTEEVDVPRQYGGPPKKPAGQVQSDYFIKRDDKEDTAPRGPKKPVGQLQSDYYQSRQTGPRSEVDESPININMGTNPKKQSKSFKVLQWMTETEREEPEGTANREISQKPRRNKDPERRHNADDDEMTFSGLHSKANIPSKAFGILQRLSSDDGSAPTQNGKSTLDVGEPDDFEEQFLRYRGKNIPSPSFRVLQTWAESDPDPVINNAGSRKDEEQEDNLPETLNDEDLVDKRYKGAHIPSKVFKVLQKSLGDETSESSSQATNAPSGGGQVTAPISEF